MRRSLVAAMMVAACSSYDSAEDAKPAPAEAGAPVLDAGADADVDASRDAQPPAAVDGGATAQFATAVRALPGLVAYWRLGDASSGDVADTIGGNRGTVDKAATTAGLLATDPDGAAVFDKGATIKVAVSAASNLITFDTGLTVGLIVRPATVSADQVVLQKFGSFGLGLLKEGRPFFDVSQGANNLRLLSGSPGTPGKPMFVVGTFDGTRRLLVVDGDIVVSGDGPSASEANTSAICIGGASISANGTCSTFNFSGVVDEVFLANRAASQADIVKLAELAGLR